jgi:hypothetical protein
MAGPHRWIKQTPSSWVAASFDTNLLPGNNEKVIFDGFGQGSVVGGLNQAAVDLDLLQIDEAYTGNIGAVSDPLIISADEVVYQGSGTMHYRDGNGITDLMIVESPNVLQAAVLSGDTITRLRVLNGRVQLVSGFTGTISTLEIAPSGVDTNTYVEVLPNGFCLISELFMNGGVFDTGNTNVFSLSTCRAMINGGLWRTAQGIDAVVETDIRLYLFGGTIIWESTDANDQWIGQLHLIGGTFDARLGGRKTIAALYLWDQADFQYINSKMTINSTVRMKP